MSEDELDNIISVRCPSVKRKIKPRAQSRASDHLILPL
jgi:hypothetical protein